MKYLFTIAIAVIVVGCGERLDGTRIMNMLFWMGDHPILAGAIFTVLTPFIAMIPVVGAPFSAIWARVGIAVIPALKQIAEAREKEEDERRSSVPDRSMDEFADIVVDDLRKDPGSIVGNVPGAGVFARIAARNVGRRLRKRRKKRK